MAASPDALAFAYENPRPEVAAMVPAVARTVLDLGCSSGALGATLSARVTGVEADPAYAARARERLADVIEADLESWDPASLNTSFDCVICADVLEHLRAPEDVLARAMGVLEPGGSVVVSLPNVRHWETFWNLAVRGTWPRRSMGIFDRTHLRWFTLRDAWNLLSDAGLEVQEVHRVHRIRPEGPLETRTARLLGRTPLRTLVTYQHVLRATRSRP